MMTKRVEITESILTPFNVAPTDTIVRFHFADRWDSHGLPDAYVEVTFARDRDAVVIRSCAGPLTIGPEASNAIIVAPMDMYGGEAEILKLRREKTELVHQVNVAQDAFSERAKRKGSRR